MKTLNELITTIPENVDVQMPNEIYTDLKIEDFKTYNHKSFAYAYYYLSNYLYRNCIYGALQPEGYGLLNNANIFVSDVKQVSYIVKKGGLLDSIGYTETTTNYPIMYYFDNDTLLFSLIQELKNRDVIHSPRLSVKMPVKSLVRFGDEDFTGTYYDFQNTHLIKFKRFSEIINDKELGHNGLFIYGYIKMMSDRFKDGYIISNDDLADIVGCSERVITKYTKSLESKGYIFSERVIKGVKSFEKKYTIVGS